MPQRKAGGGPVMTDEKVTVGRQTIELSNTGKALLGADGITTTRVRKEGGSLRQVVCDKPATLVYLADQACIELLGARQDFGTVREFARQAAGLLAARNPDMVTTEQRRDKRGPRIYADLMRNAFGRPGRPLGRHGTPRARAGQGAAITAAARGMTGNRAGGSPAGRPRRTAGGIDDGAR